MASLGLGLQQWLAKGPARGLSYISSQVFDRSLIYYIDRSVLVENTPFVKFIEKHIVFATQK